MDNNPRKKSKYERRNSVSLFSKELDKIYEILDLTPEIRWDKVNNLMKLISSGQYHVPEELIAEKMIQEFLAELVE